jgi:hypothetical protein
MASEIEAMGQIEKAIAGLEPDEAERVVNWVVAYARTKLGATVPQHGVSATAARSRGDVDPAEAAQQFERIGDLVDAAEPANAPDYALVATYWFQQLQGNEHVTGQQVNDELKDLGHGIANITDAFTSLQERKPAHARQVEKSGSSKQARKRYRLTQAGIRRVQEMIASSEEA